MLNLSSRARYHRRKIICEQSCCSGSDLRRAIALARHRAPKCCTRRVIFSAPWSTHKQTRSKESDFSLSYSSLCPPKESDLSLSCHFQNLSTDVVYQCQCCLSVRDREIKIETGDGQINIMRKGGGCGSYLETIPKHS